MRTFFRAFFFTLLILSALTISFVAGVFYHKHTTDDREQFPILDQAYEILLTHGYSQPPAAPALEYGMIKGMLSAYGDPYTSFSEPAQHELQTDSLQGAFGGIGVTLGNDAFGFYVLFPFPDSPAARAGILDGDRLVMVDTLAKTPETSSKSIQAALRGPVDEPCADRLQVRLRGRAWHPPGAGAGSRDGPPGPGAV